MQILITQKDINIKIVVILCKQILFSVNFYLIWNSKDQQQTFLIIYDYFNKSIRNSRKQQQLRMMNAKYEQI
ncbi:hypothetical protein pb186bvf_011420 [Paramecium bursaria]